MGRVSANHVGMWELMANGLGLRKTSDAQFRAAKLPRLPAFKVFYAVAVTTVCALILVGCTPEQKPTDTPSASASSTVASSAPSSTSVPPTTAPATSAYQAATKEHKALNVPVPVLPEKAKEFSKAGIEAFATYWYATLNYAYETGNLLPMQAITEKTCTNCAEAGKSISDIYSGGGWIVGGRVIVKSADSKFLKDPNGQYQVIVTIRQSKGSYYDRSGKELGNSPEGIFRPDIVIADYRAGQWSVHVAQHLTSE